MADLHANALANVGDYLVITDKGMIFLWNVEKKVSDYHNYFVFSYVNGIQQIF